MVIKGAGINKSFGSNHVLRDVDLEIHPGEVAVLVGPNGCGKSTLLRALALLDPPDSGVVQVGDEVHCFPRNGERPPPPWPAVTVVFQQLFLWPHLTVERNLSLALRGADADLPGVIREFALEDLLYRYPNQISLGQKQRVALARAVALRPKYLLLDEITSALDVDFVKRLGTYLRGLVGQGVGVLIISHLLGFARGIGDRLAFMDAGRIVERGGLDLLDRPRSPEMQRFLSLHE